MAQQGCHRLLASEKVATSGSELIQEVWNCDYVGDQRVVDVHIGQIRKKIEIDATQPKLIQTVRGVGYKFELPGTTQHNGKFEREPAFSQRDLL